jgi:hypothetical protein
MAERTAMADHGDMLTCSLCGGTVTTCAACHGSCADPLCHACRDSDTSVAHATRRTLTLTSASPVVLT